MNRHRLIFHSHPTKYQGDKRDFVVYNPQGGSDKKVVALKDLINFVGSDNPSTQVELGMGGTTNFYPTRNVMLPVDKKQVLENGTVSMKDSAKIVNQVQWQIQKNTIDKNDLIELDIIATNAFKRPYLFFYFRRKRHLFRLDRLFAAGRPMHTISAYPATNE